jgi:hypothetical protein
MAAPAELSHRSGEGLPAGVPRIEDGDDLVRGNFFPGILPANEPGPAKLKDPRNGSARILSGKKPGFTSEGKKNRLSISHKADPEPEKRRLPPAPFPLLAVKDPGPAEIAGRGREPRGVGPLRFRPSRIPERRRQGERLRKPGEPLSTEKEGGSCDLPLHLG